MRRFVVTVAALAGLSLATVATAQTVAVHSSASRGKGHHHSQAVRTDPGNLAAEWWQLPLTLPPAISPFFHPQACALGQHGPTWFLYSTSPQLAALGTPAISECTIPAGQRILIGLFPELCIPDAGTTFEDNCPPDAVLDTPALLRLEIDGVDYSHLIERRISNKPFTADISINNSIGFSAGIFKAVLDGYYALIPALTPGDHTLLYQSAVQVDETTTIAFDTLQTVHIVEPAVELPADASTPVSEE